VVVLVLWGGSLRRANIRCCRVGASRTECLDGRLLPPRKLYSETLNRRSFTNPLSLSLSSSQAQAYSEVLDERNFFFFLSSGRAALLPADSHSTGGLDLRARPTFQTRLRTVREAHFFSQSSIAIPRHLVAHDYTHYKKLLLFVLRSVS